MENKALTTEIVHLSHTTKTMAVILAIGGGLTLIAYAIHEHYGIKIASNGIIFEPTLVTS